MLEMWVSSLVGECFVDVFIDYTLVHLNQKSFQALPGKY